ncbi:MAG TPA: cytochrome P450 [Hyphomicrobiaceae bacterium]|jgi:cytochrome P450|nr:cytochrome P450 [Hyphomicrobiaceae bacterium]
MSQRPPVKDWATDFDHLDPAWVNDPFPIWDELRQKCPIAHTERFNGVYLPTRYEDVRAIAYDPEHFSSRKVIVRESPPPQNNGAPPITSDPPRHRLARMALLPPFTPQAIEKLTPLTRALCNELIDAFAGKGGCDAAVEYSQHLPVKVIAHMLGIPQSDGDRFRGWVKLVLQDGITDDAATVRGFTEIREYFEPLIRQRRADPGDDLVSYLTQQTYPDGRQFTDNHVHGSVQLLLVAGIDTTWSGIGSCLWHLAKTPADRERLVHEPSLMPLAIEEFLRAYSPVTMAREVAKETEVGGCTFKPGEMVLLSFPAANRDPKMFADADKVLIDRKENRHAAFGLGIHRCVGSNLARMEMTVAVEEFLKRIPEFHLAGEVTWSEGSVRGPRKLPLRFGPA